MSKIALLCYHSNAQVLYKEEWINAYRDSILFQTHKYFSIFEHNYDGGLFRIFENSYFESVKMPTFVHALNYLLDKCFSSGYDFIYNSNADDINSFNRIEIQLPYLEEGFDIVSSNFALLQDDSIVKYHKFHNLNIAHELSKNHNPICHPVVGYSKKFIMNNRYIPEQQPKEDMMLWQRTINDYKFIILEENLLYHRIHNNAVCRSDNK